MAAYQIDDCCVLFVVVGEPVLELNEGDTDPFTGETIGWPFPRVYWSNGSITDGHYTPVE